MDAALFSDLISPPLFAVCCAVALLAGFVKGATGFAMPMIIISGLGTFLPPDVALAGLILSTVVSNLWQAVRGGMAGIFGAAKDYWRYVAALLVMILVSAPLVTRLPEKVIFLALGSVVICLVGLLLSGWRLQIDQRQRRVYDLGLGGLSGVIGGVSGVWGPLTVAYLTAVDTPKKMQVKLTGVIFGVGACMLFLAHLRSGVLNAQTLPFSAALVVPALLGMAAGHAVQDRLDQHRFRRLTLFVLLIAGFNLIRRGIF